MAATACSECGFDPSSMTVQDAITTLRSLPRRWRDLAAQVDDDDVAARDALLAKAEAATSYERVAAEAEAVDADDWKDSARLGALLDQVHAGVHELRAAERAAD